MTFFADAQSALPFVMAQGRNIEPMIYRKRYPSFEYANIMPVITEGSPWAIGTQFMTMDMAGEAKFLSGAASDIPFNQVTHGTASHDFDLIGSGWEWNMQEINQASIYGINLSADKAFSATRSVEKLLYDIAMVGSTEKGWKGFTNQTSVTPTNSPGNGTSSSTYFSAKTGIQILAELNALLSGIRRATKEIEDANTIALPPAVFDDLGTRLYINSDGTSSQKSILEVFRTNNVYTIASGAPINIKSVRDLATAASDGSGRIVAYRNEVDVIRFHLPMPRNVLPVRQKSLMGYETGIIARTGGVEVRLPGAMAYLDKVSAAS